MSAVLLGVYVNHDTAERVRTDLVMDGFPTDRVELTDWLEPGRAGVEPAVSLHEKLVQYFRTLFCFDGERHYAEVLANRERCRDHHCASPRRGRDLSRNGDSQERTREGARRARSGQPGLRARSRPSRWSVDPLLVD